MKKILFAAILMCSLYSANAQVYKFCNIADNSHLKGGNQKVETKVEIYETLFILTNKHWQIVDIIVEAKPIDNYVYKWTMQSGDVYYYNTKSPTSLKYETAFGHNRTYFNKK